MKLDAIGRCAHCHESVTAGECICWCDYCDQFYTDCLVQDSWCLDVER